MPPPTLPGNPNVYLSSGYGKKKESLQQQAFFTKVNNTLDAGPKKGSKYQAGNIKTVPTDGPRQVFQAPHQGVETMKELSDDTAPTVGGWQPTAFQPVNQFTPGNPGGIPFTPGHPGALPYGVGNTGNPFASASAGPNQFAHGGGNTGMSQFVPVNTGLNQFVPVNTRSQQFSTGNPAPSQSGPPTNKPGKKNKKPIKPPNPAETTRTLVEPTISSLDVIPMSTETLQEEDDGEIKWELNTIDEQDVFAIPTATETGVKDPLIQKGPASQIKLTIQTKPKPSNLGKFAPTFVKENKSKTTEIKPQTTSRTLSSSQKASRPKIPAAETPIVQSPFAMLSANNAKAPAGIPRSFLAMQLEGPPQGNPIQLQPKPEHQQIPTIGAPPPQAPIYVETDVNVEVPQQQYSPSDVYDVPGSTVQDPEDDPESPESEAGRKRLSAFQRLGPQTQPKKPKLTINLTNKADSVREVVEPEEIIPVHLRQDIIDSTDETVVKFLPSWPWKKPLIPRKTVTARQSKSAMLLEQEQMEEVYEKDSTFVQVSVRGYPPTWSKEDVLDAVLEGVKGKSFIPCFIEFTREDCKFLVIKSRPALTVIHKLGFYIRKEEVQLLILLHKIDLTLKQLCYLPRLVLRKRLAKGYDSERRLDLKEFTLQPDVSHFIYFPLNRTYNQMELVQLQSTVVWEYLTDLDLSHNRLTSVDGFDLPKTTPRLKNLDLSFNYLERATALLRCKNLSLKTLRLEGNPLCHDYTDPDQYVKVLRMMFPSLMEIDGIPVKVKGDLPGIKQNYCPDEAKPIVDKFLEVFFPLLDSGPEERIRIEDLYDERATLTITYKHKIRYTVVPRLFRNLFLRARVMEEGEMDAIEGATSISKLICRWPAMLHDPATFTVDVMAHNETATILRLSGIFKITSDTLAEDEHLMTFTRTLVLMQHGPEYKIHNEMLYWQQPIAEYANTAFKCLNLRSAMQRPSLKLDSAPDEELKEELTKIFMKITEIDKKKSEKCLERNEWNLKYALEHFMKLLKLDDLGCLENHDRVTAVN